MNGVDHPSESIHVLHVGKMRMKLRKGKTTNAKEYYSISMQVFVLKFLSTVLTLDIISLFGYVKFNDLPFKSAVSHTVFLCFSYVELEEVGMLQLRHCFGKQRKGSPLY